MIPKNKCIENKRKQIDYLLKGDPVCALSGDEFQKEEGVSLRQQVVSYFNSQGNTATTIFGEVFLDNKGVKSDIFHGLTREKAIAFAAVKPTLENGIVILPLEYYHIHGKKQKTGIIAAPITIKEEKYICIVIVIRNTTLNRLYAHEVFLTKNLLEDVADSYSNAVRVADIPPVTHPQGEVAKLLKKLIQQQ